MDEYQISDLASGVLSNFLTTFTVFMSIITAYQVPQVLLVDFSWYIALLYVALAAGSIVFMSNVRHQTSPL